MTKAPPRAGVTSIVRATPFLTDVRETLVELNDLKRITAAGRQGSIAMRLFADAWAALVAGASAADVAAWITGRAVAAARLGDIDDRIMADAGVPRADRLRILHDACDAVTAAWPDTVRQQWRAGLTLDLDAQPTQIPAFVASLAAQPRAGITCPGKPRLMLEPPESHADHCLMVAVYGVLLAHRYDGDPARIFLAALAHHFHNAGMPDSGFTGEVLLGAHLDTVILHYTTQCLETLAPLLRAQVVDARAILPDAVTPEGRAFHAADVLDRVLQSLQYTRAASLSTGQMLTEMELVHAGPVKGFHDDVLREAGLL